ncbi:hypothetical protein PP707_04005 [Acetobacter pasteurianus]|nr:hypothetical protein [Acetobacter pasteurianus]
MIPSTSALRREGWWEGWWGGGSEGAQNTAKILLLNYHIKTM